MTAVDPALSTQDVAAAVDAVATHHAVWRSLAAALESDSDALAQGAPPAVGRLVTELIARGSTTLSEPRCVVCGRTGGPLTVTEHGGMCKRCAARRNPAACTHCGAVKPVAGRGGDGEPICEACRRRAGPRRRARHLRHLLSAARRYLPCVRAVAAVHLRHQRPTDLQTMRPADERCLRPLRPQPPTGGPLG